MVCQLIMGTKFCLFYTIILVCRVDGFDLGQIIWPSNHGQNHLANECNDFAFCPVWVKIIDLDFKLKK